MEAFILFLHDAYAGWYLILAELQLFLFSLLFQVFA